MSTAPRVLLLKSGTVKHIVFEHSFSALAVFYNDLTMFSEIVLGYCLVRYVCRVACAYQQKQITAPRVLLLKSGTVKHIVFEHSFSALAVFYNDLTMFSEIVLGYCLVRYVCRAARAYRACVKHAAARIAFETKCSKTH